MRASVSAIVRHPAENMIHVVDEKAANTAGGTFSSGAWQTRTLNTVKNNTIAGASLASNQITLPAGTYFARGHAPAFSVGGHICRLYNTAGAVLLEGTTSSSNSAGNYCEGISHVAGLFVLPAERTIELQHKAETGQVTEGFGRAGNVGAVEIYSQLIIYRVK